jgi:hypothetical protein
MNSNYNWLGVGVVFNTGNCGGYTGNQTWVTENFGWYTGNGPNDQPIRGVRANPVTPFGQIVLSPDVTGDGRGEVLGVDKVGQLVAYPGSSSGTLGSPLLVGKGFSSHTVYAPGDWNRDGQGDVLTVTSDAKMYFFAGTGFAQVKAGVEVGHGWGGYTVIPAGDLTGDGAVDLLAIKDSTGRLYLYAGTGKGGFTSTRKEVGHGWTGGLKLYAAGDLNRDGKADILAVDKAGVLWAYAGRGNGTFGVKKNVGHGWNTYQLAAGADLNGDGLGDIVGRDNTARTLYFYKGQGGGSFAAKKQIGSGW